ncbi:MAG: SDR family oxidoreductase [Thalassospira sp.]|nr:SDR family oxidoreductase [Thalassospira sp.]
MANDKNQKDTGLQRLQGKHALITDADAFMGPATAKHFAAEGARITQVTEPISDESVANAHAEKHADVDILVLNFAGANNYGKTVEDVTDAIITETFERMVYPLHRMVRAFAPEMKSRGRGKIIVYGSAVPLRPMPRLSAYTAARGAQAAYVKSAGVELAKHNIQVNLIAQNWVENPEYYPPELQAHPKFKANLEREVPLGRLAKPEEDTALAVFLASSESDFMVGQVIPFAGGWAS